MMIAAVVFLFWFVYNRFVLPRKRLEAAMKTPAQQTQAVLINKTQKIRKAGHGSTSDLYLVFELPDGVRKDFRVDTSVYNTVMEGEEGVITYYELNDTRVLAYFINC